MSTTKPTKQSSRHTDGGSITVSHFGSSLKKLSEQPPPIPKWMIRHLAEIAIQLIDSSRYQVAQLLEKFILKERSHYARCGLYIIDAICNLLFAQQPNSSVPQFRAPREINVSKFLSTIDEMLPRIFYSFIKRERHRIQGEVASETASEVKLSSRDQIWVLKLLRRWYQHHFFRDSTIMYTSEKLHLQKPTRHVTTKRKWKEFSSSGKSVESERKKKRFKPPKVTSAARIRFQDLPVEIVLRIFSLLPPKELCGIAMTNSYFYQISKDKSLWNTISIHQTDKQVSLQKLLNWTKYCWEQVQYLELAHCLQVNDNVLEIFAEHFHNLKKLNLKGCNSISNLAHVAALVSHNSNQLISIDFSNLLIEDNQNNVPFDECKNLQSLSVAEFQQFDKAMMQKVFDNCKELSFLDISYCSWLLNPLLNSADIELQSNSLGEIYFLLTSHGIIIENKHVTQIISRFPCLKKISMHTQDLKEEEILLSNGEMKVAVSQFDARIAVYLNNFEFLKEIVTQMPKQLYLRGCENATLLLNAINIGNIDMIEFLCSLNIPSGIILEEHVKRLVSISKSLRKVPGRRNIIINNTSKHGDNYEFLLRLLIQMISENVHPNVCRYCASPVDIYSEKQSFMRWMFSTARQARRQFFSSFCKWDNFRLANRYLRNDTAREITLEAARADITFL